MKVTSIIGIIVSIGGICVSVANWYVFTLQALGSTTTEYANGKTEICTDSLEHHEHSITLLIILCVIFLFFLFYSIFSLLNHSKKD
jgi:hypothetical protein